MRFPIALFCAGALGLGLFSLIATMANSSPQSLPERCATRDWPSFRDASFTVLCQLEGHPVGTPYPSD